MNSQNIGILHPGAMGLSIAAAAQNSGHTVHWVSAGRSEQTHARVAKFNLVDTGNLAQLCQTCPLIISICPPHAAETVAHQVIAHNFTGLYLDANAISPQRVVRIEQAITKAGATFVDGGIIGGPAWKPGQTWLHLAGHKAESVAVCFSAGPLETSLVSEVVGQASALKMCYAAYTKGTTALLCAILAAAEKLEVRGELEQQWALDGAELDKQAIARARRVTAKAWRFRGEMDEIAATFQDAGLPGGFHQAAGEIYRRLADFKDAPTLPALEEVLEALGHVNEVEKG